tara:strand:- start:730 stop:1770 length:1041 start_codon:yes stop_codon:yes gene_type:complete
MTDTKYEYIDIEEIAFDIDNPRIIKELSSFPLDEQQDKAGPFLLLSHSDEPGPAREELENSIIANNGISNPIDIVPNDDNNSSQKYKVIDGNTRLALYKKLNKKNPDNDLWKKILSCVYPDGSDEKLDDIRLLSHFMPPKQWSLYAKGQYINRLCKTKNFDEIAQKLGGRTSTIKQLRDAFVFFTEEYEKKIFDKGNAVADESKFSHFVEAGKGAVKVALESHFGNLDKGKEEFAKWVHDDKFRMAIHVRKIPAVFSDDNAKTAFLNGEVDDIEAAAELLPSKNDSGVNLVDADLEQLSMQLSQKLKSTTRQDMNLMIDGRMSSTVDSLLLLFLDLEKVLDEIENK